MAKSTHKTYVKIARLVICLESVQAPQPETAQENRARKFISTKRPGKVDITLRIRTQRSFSNLKPRVLFKTANTPSPEDYKDPAQRQKTAYLGPGLHWRFCQLGKKYLLEGGMSGDFQVLLDPDLKKGMATIIDKDNEWKISGVIYGFLQVLCIAFLAKHRLGVIVHSSGIKDGRYGYLFPGPSRAGKSTTSRIWHKHTGARILNDDRVVVRKDNGRFFLHGTPWHGDFRNCMETAIESVELKKIFFIYHRKTNRAARVNARDGFHLFFQSTFCPFWDKGSLEFISEFLLDALGEIPSFQFGFKNNRRIVSFVRKLNRPS